LFQLRIPSLAPTPPNPGKPKQKAKRKTKIKTKTREDARERKVFCYNPAQLKPLILPILLFCLEMV